MGCHISLQYPPPIRGVGGTWALAHFIWQLVSDDEIPKCFWKVIKHVPKHQPDECQCGCNTTLQAAFPNFHDPFDTSPGRPDAKRVAVSASVKIISWVYHVGLLRAQPQNRGLIHGNYGNLPSGYDIHSSPWKIHINKWRFIFCSLGRSSISIGAIEKPWLC